MPMTAVHGTVYYVAPEVLSGSGYSKSADMWSVGIIMHLVLRGALPFQGDTDKEIIENIEQSAVSLDGKKWMKRTPELRDFVRKLLSKRPEARLSAQEALSHPWMLMGKVGAQGAAASALTSSVEEAPLMQLSVPQLEQRLSDCAKASARLEAELAKSRATETELEAELAKRAAAVVGM